MKIIIKVLVSVFTLFLSLIVTSQENSNQNIEKVIDSILVPKITGTMSMMPYAIGGIYIDNKLELKEEEVPELYRSALIFVNKKLSPLETKYVNLYSERIKNNSDFRDLANKFINDNFSTENIVSLLEKENVIDSDWLTIRTVRQFDELKSSIETEKKITLKELEGETYSVLDAAFASFPENQNDRISYLSLETDKFDEVHALWSEMLLGQMTYELENLNKGDNESQCWVPDGTFRKHLTKIRFRGFVFQCVQFSAGGMDAYTFVPSMLVDVCNESSPRQGCNDIFDDKQWADISNQIN